MRKLLCCLLFAGAAMTAHAQSADWIEALLSQDSVNYADAGQVAGDTGGIGSGR